MRPRGGRSRVHGDYRLERVLVAQDDLVIVGFGGAPGAGREKTSPLGDVAAMLLSLHEAAANAFRLAHPAPERESVLAGRVAEWSEAALEMRPGGGVTRVHGDYRLARVLLAQDDLAIIGFGGAPEAGRDKASPLRDAASMLLSIHETAAKALRAAQPAPEREPVLVGRVAEWSMTARREFLAAYREHVAGSPSHPCNGHFAEALLDLFVIGSTARAIESAMEQGTAPIEGPLTALAELARPGLNAS
jgi:maltose alpha-D-glucosyltransferase/alpha-amylase